MGGHRNYYWGRYHSAPQLAEADYHNRAEDYQRRHHIREVEQERPQPGPYEYYSTQRPIDIGTYPQSYFNKPVFRTCMYPHKCPLGGPFPASPR